jgi:hypothetical protein
MYRTTARRPEDREICPIASLDEPGSLTVWDTLDVGIGCQQLQPTAVGDLEAATPKECGAALLAVEHFEYSMAFVGGCTEDAGIQEQWPCCPAIVRRRA